MIIILLVIIITLHLFSIGFSEDVDVSSSSSSSNNFITDTITTNQENQGESTSVKDNEIEMPALRPFHKKSIYDDSNIPTMPARKMKICDNPIGKCSYSFDLM